MGFNTTAKAFFRIDADGYFVGNAPARGPWDERACHAGPVTGVIARALESHLPDKQLFRLTVELRRPVPTAGFRVEAESRKLGRTISTARARVLDRNDELVATAESVHAQTSDVGELPSVAIPPPEFGAATVGAFPIKQARHGQPAFASGVQVAYPPGQDGEPGPTTLWMRTIPLLEDEPMSPFQSVCPLADCGNATSRNLEVTSARFLNPDLTLILHRLPESEWLASEAYSSWEPTGLGMAHAMLFDRRGAIGVALQTLLVGRT